MIFAGKLRRLWPALVALCVACSVNDSDSLEADVLSLLLSAATPDTGSVAEVQAFLADSIQAAPANPALQPANCPHSALGGFKDTAAMRNGIRGAGDVSGSLDVYSMRGWTAEIVVSWSGRRVNDGPGVDFIVFENGFEILPSGSGNYFMEPAFVEVSRDGVNWCGFAPRYVAADPTTHSRRQADWLRFAGRAPVHYNQELNPLSFDEIFRDANDDGVMDLAGGDGFDLGDLSADNSYGTGCSVSERDAIQSAGFVYLRLIDSNRRNDPNTGNPFPWAADSFDCASDYDGLLARYIAER